MNGISIDMPCQRHVAQYLRNTYGCNPRLSKRHHEGLFLLNQLERQRRNLDTEIGAYDDVVSVEISIDDMERFGHALTPTAIIEFNNLIDDHLKKLFCAHMDALVNHASMKKAVAIRLFQDEYDYPEEAWKYDTLKKYYDRIQKRRLVLKAA